MPNSRLINEAPNSRIVNEVPASIASSFQTGHAGETKRFIKAGTPIGLLLALTYAADFTVVPLTYGDERPNSRIVNY